MNRIQDEHRRRNALTRDNWVPFTVHRRHIMRLLTAECGPDRELCILGAGNCNDLELPALAAMYRRTLLIDLDQEALQQGLQRQLPASHPAVATRRVEVTGALDELAARPPGTVEADWLDAWCRRAAAAPKPIPETFDVVASVCLISQLVDSLVQILGQAHPQFLAAVAAIRGRHLKLLRELTKPGGAFVLVSDFVSSLTVPELPRLSEQQIAQRLPHWIASGNFFTGLNPFVLLSLMRGDPGPEARGRSIGWEGVWRWDLGAREYAVVAFRGTNPSCHQPPVGRDLG